MDIAEIAVGQTVTLRRTLTDQDLAAFAALCGDYNPLHMDAGFAGRTSFQRRVVHGMLVGSFVSTLVGMHVPGPGALWSRQTFRWVAPVFIGDTIEVQLTVTQKSVGAGAVSLGVKVMNQNGKTVMEGEGVATLVERRSAVEMARTAQAVALVTGASRGIGAAIARAMAGAGFRVAVNYLHHEAEALAVCRAIEEQGGQATAVQADVRDGDRLSEVVEQIAGEFGDTVQILVNNAAAPTVLTPFANLSWNDVEAHTEVQVKGAFAACKAVLPGMLTRKSGVIVNIGSALTRGLPPAGAAAFLMAKSALHGMTRALAAELGPQGIRVNTVSPGMTDSESLASMPERLRKVEALRNPLRRLASPEDVAATVAFLCSDGGRYINGADIPVSGGMSM